MWKALLIIAGLHDSAIGAYHLVLPRQWNWAAGLQTVPPSLVWGIYIINYSWSLLILTIAGLIFYAAAQGPTASLFARRVVFAVGLFWAFHGTYLWLNPVPVPAKPCQCGRATSGHDDEGAPNSGCTRRPRGSRATAGEPRPEFEHPNIGPQ